MHANRWGDRFHIDDQKLITFYNNIRSQCCFETTANANFLILADHASNYNSTLFYIEVYRCLQSIELPSML
jgi:hypothetical protein